VGDPLVIRKKGEVVEDGQVPVGVALYMRINPFHNF
jgi:hypothetical protein